MKADVLSLDESVIRSPRNRWNAGEVICDEDLLVIEEPLEIRLGNYPLAVVMRTPGHDIELVTGFALTELLVKNVSELLRVSHCTEGANGHNVVRILPAAHAGIDPTRFARNLFTSSSCGVCGKQSIERAMLEAPPLVSGPTFSAEMLCRLPEALRSAQLVFAHTGALHAAALAEPSGKLWAVREDIGRHNAVDKVVGHAARAGLPLAESALVVSGRASYEIVQKALAARVSLIVSVGGVSSLAVDLARRAGCALVGFARPGSLSIYAGEERIR